MNAESKLSGQVEGRIIHLSFDVTLLPPNHPVKFADLGDTDVAWDIGMGLIREVVLMLKNTCEAEGFVVEVKSKQVVY